MDAVSASGVSTCRSLTESSSRSRSRARRWRRSASSRCDAERPRGDFGRDVRVAVAVAADPRAVAHDGAEALARGLWRLAAARRPRSVVLLPVGLAESAAQVAVDLGDDVPDRRRDEVEPVADLVLDGDVVGADLVGRQKQAQAVADVGLGAVALGGRDLVVAERVEQAGGLALVEQNRAPPRLGGVRRQRRLDVELPHPFQRLLAARARGLELVDRVGQRLAARGLWRRRPRPLAVHAHDLVLLGLVDEVEVGRQRPQHARDLLRGGLRQRRGHRVEALRAALARGRQKLLRERRHVAAVALLGDLHHEALGERGAAGERIGEAGGLGGGEGRVGHESEGERGGLTRRAPRGSGRQRPLAPRACLRETRGGCPSDRAPSAARSARKRTSPAR